MDVQGVREQQQVAIARISDRSLVPLDRPPFHPHQVG